MFEIWANLAYFNQPMRPRGSRVMDSSFHKENWHCSFQKVKNIKVLTDDAQSTMHDDGKKSVSIGNPSDSGNLKIAKGYIVAAILENIIKAYTQLEILIITITNQYIL